MGKYTAIRVYGFTPDNQPPTAKDSNQVTKAVICTDCLEDLNAFVLELEKKDGTTARNSSADVIAPVAIEVYFDNTYRWRGAVETLRIFGIIGEEAHHVNPVKIHGFGKRSKT